MFSFNIEFLQKEQVAKITTFGILDQKGDEQMVLAAVDAAKKYKTRLFLVDHRQVDVAIEVLYLSDIPKKNERLGVTNNFKIALVCDKDSGDLGKFEYFDNLSHIKGYNRELFTDIEAALNWLTAS